MKYLLNGAEVEIIAETPKGFLVCNIFETEDGPCSDDGNPFIVGKVYDTAPTQKLSGEIALLQTSINELTATRSNLSGDVRELEAKINSRKEAIKQHEQLKYLEDFIAGKITHYVEMWGYGGPKIVEFSKEFCGGSNEYDRPRALKLLTLFGDSKGDLSWRLDRYKDGSGGSSTVVFPARSMEEAIQFIKDYIAQQAIETADRPRDWVIETAKKYSVPLPDGYVEKHNAYMVESIRSTMAKTQKNLDDYQKELEKFLPAEPPTN